MDLRKSLSNIMDEYSHKAIYIRTDKRFRCSCYIERSGEGWPECPYCFGTTYRVSIQTIRCRRDVKTLPETLMGQRKQKGTGLSSAMTFTYYMEHNVQPKAGDLVLEVEWVNGMPMNVLEKNEISSVNAQLGTKGRIEFYQVYCKYSPKGANDNDALSGD